MTRLYAGVFPTGKLRWFIPVDRNSTELASFARMRLLSWLQIAEYKTTGNPAPAPNPNRKPCTRKPFASRRMITSLNGTRFLPGNLSCLRVISRMPRSVDGVHDSRNSRHKWMRLPLPRFPSSNWIAPSVVTGEGWCRCCLEL